MNKENEKSVVGTLQNEHDRSVHRMMCALEKSVNVYTEINLDTLRYRQINLQNSEFYTASPEGDYPDAFEMMCTQQIHPDDVPQMRALNSPEALRKQADELDEVSVRYRLKNAKTYTVMQSKVYFMRDNGVRYAISLASDVTQEIKSAEQKKQQEHILENIEAGIINIEFRGDAFKVVATNQTLCPLIGRCNQELLAMDENAFVSLVMESDREKCREMLNTLRQPGRKHELECRVINQNGSVVWLEARGKSMQTQEDVVMVFITFSDVTKTKTQSIVFENNMKAIALAQKQGKIAIWTYDIDKKEISQYTYADKDSEFGYPARISDVPQSFVESGSIHPEDVQKYLEIYEKLDQNAEAVDLVYRLMNRHTHVFDWVHMYYQRVYNDELTRAAIGFSVVVNQQQEQLARYKSELALRQQIFASADLSFELDITAGRIIKMKGSQSAFTKSDFWNDRPYSQYFDYVYELTEESYREQIEKMDIPNLLKAFDSGETKVTIEFLGRGTKDAPLLYYRTSCYMMLNPDSGHLMAFLYTENIDEEMIHRQAIETSLEEGVESIALIHVPDGKSYLLKTTRRMKFKETGIVFRYDSAFVEQSSKGTVPEERESAFKKGRLSTIMEELSKNEVYEYRTTMMPETNGFEKMQFRFKYLDQRKTNIVFIILDVTGVYQEEQKHRQELQLALDEAKRANESTNQFFSRMSHDMRTPMNAILGLARLSRDESELQVLKNNLNEIEESGEYLLRLINDTLDFQRIESGRMHLNNEIENCQEILNNLSEMIMHSVREKNIDFRISSKNMVLNSYIRTDTVRLKQIFVNLLSNAVKFTPEGGSITFEMECMSLTENVFHDRFYVRDTGIGMSQAYIEKQLFKPFAQEHNEVTGQYAGSGLGLSIVKNLVDLMGGSIRVESELGTGTTFIVDLDFERVSDADVKKYLSQKAEKQNETVLSIAGHRALLVEDHPLNAGIAKKLLEKAGCFVDWAQNGQESVRAFSDSETGYYDIILMDIRMPVMDGLQAAREIRALEREDAKSIPIIAMTANAYEEDIQASLNAGMNAHLSKPIDPKKLYTAIATAIRQGSVIGK